MKFRGIRRFFSNNLRVLTAIKDYSKIDLKTINRRVISFAPGPASFPYPLMKNVQKHFIDYRSNDVSYTIWIFRHWV